MKDFRLDKTAFRKQSLRDADHQLHYWQEKSLAERLQAAWFLTCSAYGYSMDSPPRMDRNYFEYRKRRS